ncbi:1-hydroxycarotenoid 3,4-desaturase CrtD [Halomonas denitrificans]|nr:phytoene desaturase [Halomonas denitrificans]
MSARHAVVIGAGIGGLVAAVDLARRGLRVTVFERAGAPGGKMREIEIDGRPIDSGPTVFTMAWIFEELFRDAGSALDEHVAIRRADLLARHAWPDGSRLDLFADPDRSFAAVADFAGEAEAARYRAFCRRAREVFDTLYEPFMRSQRPGPLSLVAASGLRGLIDLWRIRPFDSLWRHLGASFRDPRLRALFARYATYCGSSPLQAPATLMLIAHAEQLGVWQIEGGMQRLAEALAELVRQRGGTIAYDTPVAEVLVDRERACGVVLDSGERVPTDAVIANCDRAAIARGLLGAAAADAVPGVATPDRSLSALTWSVLARPAGFELAHHNVFFPADYPREFEDIFDHHRLPARPAVYVCAQDRATGQSPPNGPERLFLITNAPATGDREPFEASAIAASEAAAFDLLRACGLEANVEAGCSRATTPADFEARFPGTGGALYGSAAHGWRSSFTRPGAVSGMAGLYLAGGSVHPGAGVPMVALSGRLAARAAAADLGLGAPERTPAARGAAS